MLRMPIARVAGLLVLALLLTACAGPAPITELRARLPLQQAGIADERLAMAPLLGLEGAALARWFEVSAGSANPMIATSAAQRRERALARAPQTVVMVIPGLLGDCVADQAAPFGDGLLRDPLDASGPYAGYAELGLLRLERLPLQGRQGVEGNGLRVAERVAYWASQRDVERLVLVGYSKGVADALEGLSLLQRSDRWPSQPVALVSMAGSVMGTPLADRMSDWVNALQPQGEIAGCGPADTQALRDMRSDVRAAWWASAALPERLQRYSVAAQAVPSQSAPLLHLLHGWLNGIDPRNDGQMLVSDALLPGGSLLALARTDHWSLALPLERHPSAWVRLAVAEAGFPREALFRAVLLWVIGAP